MTCFYQVKSECGAPAFVVDGAPDSGYDIEWVEFDSSALNDTAYEAWASSSRSIDDVVRMSPPMTDMPPRWNNFADGSGSAAVYM